MGEAQFCLTTSTTKDLAAHLLNRLIVR
jgi:hypothetical protein